MGLKRIHCHPSHDVQTLRLGQRLGIFTSSRTLIAAVTFVPFLFAAMVTSENKATLFTVYYQALQMCIAPLAQF